MRQRPGIRDDRGVAIGWIGLHRRSRAVRSTGAKLLSLRLSKANSLVDSVCR
jgi:hypothetical protein